MKGFYYLSIFLAVLTAGCGVWDDSPGVPHVIVVPEFELTTTMDEGTDSHAVEEVWVYTPTDVLGVFPLPATIPVIYDDETVSLGLTISAGIKANGIAATRRVYTFYDAIEVDYPYVPGATDTVEFHSNYIDAANIILAEDFESSNRFQASSLSVAEVVRTTDPQWVYEGEASGLILLTDSLNHIASTTQEQLYNLPSNGPKWLEFNYRCDNSFAVGMQVIGGMNEQRTPIIVLNPTHEEWKKMYLDLEPFVASAPYAFGFELTLDAILDAGKESGFVVVDNFKIVHY